MKKALFHSDSYEVKLLIEEIECEETRLAARDELAELEELQAALDQIENMPLAFGLDSDNVPYISINDIYIYMVTNGYQIEVGSTKSQINKKTIVAFIRGIYARVGAAA